MIDFEVQRFTRHCCKTQYEFQPGDRYYSVLVPDGAHVKRLDYAVAAWEGPPENALGWWQARVPDANDNKVHWAPNDVIVHLLEQLEQDLASADLRYVLALLMVRRRVARLEEVERDAQGQETLVLFCPRNEREYRVLVQQPGARRVEEIQAELARLLLAGDG